jgi:hypothetical protein
MSTRQDSQRIVRHCTVSSWILDQTKSFLLNHISKNFEENGEREGERRTSERREEEKEIYAENRHLRSTTRKKCNSENEKRQRTLKHNP